MLKLYFLHKIIHNSDTFRSILIIFRPLINVIKAYVYRNTNGLFNTLKFAHNMSADVIKFVVGAKNWFVRCVNCSIIDFYGGCIGYQNINLTSS